MRPAIGEAVRILGSLVFLFCFFSSPVWAASQSRVLFGQEQFMRTGSGTTIYQRAFTVPSYVSSPYTLHIINGNPDGSSRVAIEDAVSSGRVLIDGVEVVSPNDFSRTVSTIDKTLTLATGAHTLEVRLNSSPGSYIRLTISGVINLGNLTQARSGHTATLLSTGKILVTGGNGTSGILSSVEVFDPATLTFSAHTNALTTPRTEHTATLLPNTQALLVAGKDPQGTSFTAELFDPLAGTFRSLSNILRNLRSGHTATQLQDGRVLVAGGADGSQAALGSTEAFDPRVVDLFDPQTGVFISLPNGLTTPRINHTATLLADGRVLILGGSNSTGYLSSAEVYNPATGTFTSLPNLMTVPRAGHTATLLPDGRVLMAGGKNNSGVLESIEVFDPTTQTFTALSQGLLVARSNHTATLLPTGEILITGGENGTAVMSHTELYGPPAADVIAPTVLSISPANGATKVFLNSIVSLRFSEPIKVTTLTSSTLTLRGPTGVVTGIASPGESGLLAFFVPQTHLQAGVTYTVSLSSGIQDLAGNPLSAFISAFVTFPPPLISSFSPESGPIGTIVTIVGENFDSDAAKNIVKFNGVQAEVTSATSTRLTATVPSGATTGPITVTTPGGTATSSTNFTVITGPTITTFSPMSGPIGTAVKITGQNFDGIAANNQVRFNGTSAIITRAMTTTITTSVPQGATSGPITVITPQGSATSAESFSVTPRQDFELTAVPAQATTLQGGQVSYALSVTGVGEFTGLVSLSISGLPGTVTAHLASSSLAPRQSTMLTLNVSPAEPVGSLSFILSGTAELDSGPRTRSVPLNLEVLAGARTSLVGQFLTSDGDPIPNVQVKIGTIPTKTDAAGNFLLVDVPAGTQQLMIDANVARAGYPIYAMDVTLTAGQTTVLGPFYITPPPPPERFTPINNATANQVITDPRFPGASITLPAGVTITGWDGVPKTKIAIERLSLDRLPVPPPPGPTRSVYQLHFGTPIGGVPSAPIPFTGPNDLGLNPGEKAEMWYYDASPMGGPAGWRFAGMGTVSADGSRIVSDPGVGIPRFCGVCGLPCWISRINSQLNRILQSLFGGDPVDLQLGQMIVEKTDLILPGRFPINLSRTYNPFDPFGNIAGFQSSLGPGWYLSVDVVLLPVNGDLFRLVMPGNARLDLTRQPDGTYRNSTDPFLSGAVLSTLSGGDHQLRFKDGITWRFRFLFLGLEFLIEMVDRNGNRITIERSGAKVVQIVDTAGMALSVLYSGSKISQIADPTGRVVQYSYDASGRLSTVTDPAGGVTRYTYDISGKILTITDARNIQYIQNSYGPSGRVLRQVQADGGEWRFKYRLQGATVSGPGCPGASCPTEDSWENFQAGYTFQGGFVIATAVMDPRGNTTLHRFNISGYAIGQVNALGQQTLTVRDGSNHPIAITDPLGRATSFTYDTSGNVTSITDALGNVTTFTYEPTFNRLTRLTDALVKVTTFGYDVQGNLTSATDPLGNTTTLAYNAFGQPTSTTDSLGNTTSFEYDDFGNLAASTDPLGNRTARLYDTISRLITLTDPRGATTGFRYEALNRVTQITDALNGLTSFSYDPNGNLLTVTDAKSNSTTYRYDSMDRLATRTDPLNRQESYQYDLNGNLRTFTDRKGQISTFTYDGLNRRIQSDYADASKTEFVYDAVGRLVRVNDTASGAIDFSYDNLDRLIQEITAQGTVAYNYDAIGRRTSMSVSGLTPVTYQYDAASRLTQVAQANQTVGLGYDAVGRRTSLTYPNGTSTSYFYDPASRMTEILHQGPSGAIEDLLYTYDAAGNRISFMRANGHATLLPPAVQAAYDAANEQSQFNSATPNLTYDANGNLVSKVDASGTTTYTWDARNRLNAISGPGVSASFVYDALGRRISKTINGVTTDYQYDGNDIISEIGGGAVGTTYLRSLNIDEPFVRQSSINEYYHTDALGSVLALTDQTGAVQTNYRYDPFGNTTITGASSNPFQYTGRENDGIGLYYYRARYYSPTFQRFVSEDPLGLASGEANPYLYVFNDPLSYIDPSGLGKIGGIIRLVKVVGEQTVHITRVSFERAVELRRKGANIAATPEAMAQKIERTAHPKGELIRHEPHKKGYKPHYQTKGKRGHTFFGGLVIPGANLGDIVGRKTGSDLLKEVIDFVNPLSDVQDVLDTLDYLTGGENEED